MFKNQRIFIIRNFNKLNLNNGQRFISSDNDIRGRIFSGNNQRTGCRNIFLFEKSCKLLSGGKFELQSAAAVKFVR